MRASSGEYFEKLDHVRALAAFLVFVGHFWHVNVPYAYVPAFPPLSLLEDGYIGVSVFMVLSGYLFGKILKGRTIDFGRYIYSRSVRLLPLLLLVTAIEYAVLVAKGAPLAAALQEFALGLLGLRRLEGGGWSVVVEFQFYLILPFLLAIVRADGAAALRLLALTFLARLAVYLAGGDVANLAYFTLGGRFDQFLCGLYFGVAMPRVSGRAAACVALLLTAAIHGLNLAGDYENGARWPWVVRPLGEALAFAVLIAWYDGSRTRLWAPLARFAALTGRCSYSLYLWGCLLFLPVARLVHERLVPLDNPAVGLAVSLLAFVAFVPLAWLSYQVIERPCLALRRDYRGDHRPVSLDPARV